MDLEAIEAIYERRKLSKGNAMVPFMGTLRELASQCETAVEFGVRRCTSTVALLAGLGDRGHECLWSLDINWPERYRWIREKIQAAAPYEWVQVRHSSTESLPFRADLLLHDSVHSYEQLAKELGIHADSTAKFIAIHDTVTHGYAGQLDSCGDPDPTIKGLMPAIAELMRRDSTWQVRSHDKSGVGLMVLERRASSGA